MGGGTGGRLQWVRGCGRSLRSPKAQQAQQHTFCKIAIAALDPPIRPVGGGIRGHGGRRQTQTAHLAAALVGGRHQCQRRVPSNPGCLRVVHQVPLSSCTAHCITSLPYKKNNTSGSALTKASAKKMVESWRHPLLARCYLSNSEDTAAAVKASECSSPPWGALAARCLGSDRGVTAGGFQSASAARELLPQAATCSRAVRGSGRRGN